MKLIFSILLSTIGLSNPSLSEEMPIETKNGSLTLKGTYLEASNGVNAPTVLIIPGSGPTDRDGNNPMGVKAEPYKLLAHELSKKKINSVRIDKRGMFGSANPNLNANKVTIEDYVSDIEAWTKTIKETSEIPCVWLVGHSEGGLIALASAQTNENLCGIILISTGGYKMSDIIRRQLKANPANAPILDQAMSALDQLEAGEHVDTTNLHPAIMPIFNEQVQDYLIDIFSYDPFDLVKNYEGPILIIQGTKDIQVTMDDANRLKSARDNITLISLKNVNHVLKVVEGNDMGSNIATYGNPNLPLAPGISDAIESYIKNLGK